jgi:hypothetical protein
VNPPTIALRDDGFYLPVSPFTLSAYRPPTCKVVVVIVGWWSRRSQGISTLIINIAAAILQSGEEAASQCNLKARVA